MCNAKTIKVVKQMKKFIIFASIFLFLSFGCNTQNVFAESKILSQGLYNVKNIQLSTDINYSVRNTCPSNKSLLLVLDSNLAIQQLIRLEPNSPKYFLRQLNYDDSILIIGAANLEFS